MTEHFDKAFERAFTAVEREARAGTSEAVALRGSVEAIDKAIMLLTAYGANNLSWLWDAREKLWDLQKRIAEGGYRNDKIY